VAVGVAARPPVVRVVRVVRVVPVVQAVQVARVARVAPDHSEPRIPAESLEIIGPLPRQPTRWLCSSQ